MGNRKNLTVLFKKENSNKKELAQIARKEVTEKIVDGKQEEMKLKKGDKVIVNKYSGTEIKYEGEDLIIVKQSDVLALVD